MNRKNRQNAAKAQKGISASIRVSNPRQSAFTLIELMIVMGLMFFLTAAFVLTLRRSGNTNQLRDAAQELQSEIRNAKNDAMSGKVVSGTTIVPKARAIRLKISGASYNLLYYDDLIGNPGGVQEKPSINLPNGISIDCLNGLANQCSPIWDNYYQHIVFNNPMAKVYITTPSNSSGITSWDTTTNLPTAPPQIFFGSDNIITLKNNNGFKINITVDSRSGSVSVGNVYQ